VPPGSEVASERSVFGAAPHPLYFAAVTDIALIPSIGLIVGVSALCVMLARLIRMPSIVAYILAGLLLGPVTGWLTVSHTLELVAEVGIALLLFLVGLELSLDKIRDVGKVAIVAGIGQVVLTAAGGLVIALALGFEFMEALFLATALTFSSTVVVVKLLDQKRELNSLYGRIAVGIFLVQDLVVVLVLTFLAGLTTPASMELSGIATGLLRAFGGMALLLVAALVASRYLLQPVFRWVSSTPDALFIWSISWCFLFVLGAEVMQLSLEIGAFLAGLSLAQLPYHHVLQRRVHPLMNFFIAVFFVTLGIRMEVGAALDYWLPTLVLSLFVLLGNPLIFMVIIARFGYGERTAFMTSVTVAQISEFSFIFAGMGVAAGLIGTDILSVTAVVGLITIGVSAYMILYNEPLYRTVRKIGLLKPFRAAQKDDEPPTKELSDHVIVVGMNALGLGLVEALKQRGERVLAIDTDPAKLERLDVTTLNGSVDDPVLLEEAGLERAKLLVSALQIQDINNLLAYRCRQAGVPASIHAFDRSVVGDLRELGATHLMMSKNNGIKRIAKELRNAGVLGQ
jgi:Kef-type K+ transport system membrane component KefB